MKIPSLHIGNFVDSAVAYTTREGGEWHHISRYRNDDKAELPDSTTAVLFQSGLIWDRVLYTLGHFPWRIDPGIELESHEQTSKAVNADKAEVDGGLVEPAESWKFCVNDYVIKPRGYPYPGIISTRFRGLGHSERYVVMNLPSPGMYHIFSDSQLESMSEDLKRSWQMSYHYAG